MVLKEVILLIAAEAFLKCNAKFEIPEITLEAYAPKGLRASIPDVEGIQMFAVHGNVNKDISQLEPGEFSGEVTSPTDNMWSYFNEDLKLQVNDIVHFWVFIQYNKLGYRTAQKWTVKELLNSRDKSCKSSPSLVAKKAFVCVNGIILEDEFNGEEIDQSKWQIEEYIPTMSEDYEFVSYQKKPDILYIDNSRLFIKPKALQNENDVRGELDLRNSCTKQRTEECYLRHQTAFILPPVISGRIVSVTNFRYGKIEIKAKLPAGDWIYPQVYLEQVSDPSRKLWIAYSRGNIHLRASNDDDIGGHLLFGGPVLVSMEPFRSTYLRSKNDTKPYSDQMHTYTAIWSQDGISLLVDGAEYGKINKKEMKRINFAQNDMVRLVLGVGVGGINDFPDDFRTGNTDDKKPWRNKERAQVKHFFNTREKWSKTWSGDKTALQIDYVKILAL